MIEPEDVVTITLLPEDGATKATQRSFLLGLPVPSLQVPAGPSEVKPVVNNVLTAAPKLGATAIVAAVVQASPAIGVENANGPAQVELPSPPVQLVLT